MKSAKEMFEELGYKQLYKNKHYMFYVKDLIDTPEYEKDSIHLEFNFISETINKTYGDDNSVSDITLEELQAINKQVEELGWNDTTVNIDVKLDGKKLMEAMKCPQMLNDEIITFDKIEEKKTPMKIYWDITDNTYTTTIGDKDYKGNKNNFEELSDMYRQKINEIIDYL